MHKSGRRALLAASTIVGTAAALALGGTSSAGAATDPVLDTGAARLVTLNSTVGFPTNQQIGKYSGQIYQQNELPPGGEAADSVMNRSNSQLHRNAISPTGVPVVSSTAVNGHQGLAKSFQGLDGFDQRFANNGNQFSVEPPDQGLCAGNGFVFEVINDVLRVYKPSGAAASAVTDLNSFYGYKAAINRTTGVFGPDITDPTCTFDATTQRWFVNVLTLDRNATTGAFTGTDHLDIAVSKSANPLGGFRIYRLAVQDNGTQGTPKHKGCPCIGDYPHIATDAHALFVSTNEYPFSSAPGIFGNNYNGAQIYAFDKAGMAAGHHAVNVVQFSNTALHQGGTVHPGFTLAPAQVPGSAYDTSNNGTEHFLSSIAGAEANPGGFTGQAAAIGVYDVTNTRSISSAHPDLDLRGTLKASERYVVPAPSSQKPGPVPLANLCSVSDCLALGVPTLPSSEGPLDSNDTRMLQTYFAHGMLYSALDTGVQVGGRLQAGIAWFVVNPGSAPSGSSVARQGYVGVAGQNVIYPAVANNTSGAGAMAFTLVGGSFYPSAAYMLVSPSGVVGAVQVAAAGVGPQDGFSEYDPFPALGNPPRPRWGDYGAAVPVGSTIWIASEYINQKCSFATYQHDPTCGNTRAPLINWSTRISAVNP
jgi:hypothetical protein